MYTPTPVPGAAPVGRSVGRSVLYIAPLPLPFPPYLSSSTASDRPHTGVGASRRQAAAVSTTQWLPARCGPRARVTCRLPWGTWTKRREGRWLFGDVDFLWELSALLVLTGRTWCQSMRESQIQKRKKEDGETACTAPPCVGVVAVVIWWPSVCRTISLPLSPHSQHRQEGGRPGRLSRSPTAMPGSRTPRWR